MEFFEELYYTVSDYMYENPNTWTIVAILFVVFIIGAIGDRRYKKKRIMKLEAEFEEELSGNSDNIKMIRKEKKATKEENKKIIKKETVKENEENDVWKL